MVTDITSNITITIFTIIHCNYNIYNHTKQLEPPSYINPPNHLSKYFKPSLILEMCLLHSHFVREKLSPLKNYNIYNRTKQLGPQPYINLPNHLPKYFKPSLIRKGETVSTQLVDN